MKAPPAASTKPHLQAIDTVEDLLWRAEKLTAGGGHKQLAILAGRVRRDLTQLREYLDTATAREKQLAEEKARRDAALALVADLERQLAEAKTALRPARKTPAKKSAKPAPVERRRDGVSTSTVRAWAIAAGLKCNPQGVLPRRVVDAYHAAHPETQP